ncbi:hypothetical protein [Cohnella cholangitidis]|uniref:Mannosyl-glycoprotein endo-beta-N-acetylglucosaminidase n=1 Tax=Cohnella cholangitidis TaxID=2598458 RepID=A0A7G5C5Y2_9BACL|nr:hypothetical protein [Cohnella cholangitidis]QMV44616.1 hypothetical protein FPL14_28175 [Cohnella cholangitidis]
MDRAVVLSPTDINTIRRYVHTKYAPLPGKRRAEIVADAIRRTLQQRLPDVPEAMKNEMVDRLIFRCLVGEQRDVKPDDVLDLCAELHTDEMTFREHLLEPILQWTNERSPGRWNAEQLASRLVRRKPSTLAIVQDLSVDMEQDAQPGELSEQGLDLFKLFRSKTSAVLTLTLLGVVIVSAIGTTIWLNKPESSVSEMAAEPPVVASPPVVLPDMGMPERLRFTEIDVDTLKAYLRSRESMLEKEPYFSAIIDNAREYDIHPHLLFAITGQEQGFVPKTSKDAKLIANNPFNVGHSWMEYNTDIHNSAGIASRLIVKLAKSRPEGHDPFEWFNKTYAEDPLWSDGVRKIFDKLNSLPPSR